MLDSLSLEDSGQPPAGPFSNSFVQRGRWLRRDPVNMYSQHSSASVPLFCSKRKVLRALCQMVHPQILVITHDKYRLHYRNLSTRFTYGWMADLGICHIGE
jgi:hypothetical protein